MGGPKRARGLTNHEIVIQINLNKLADYIIVHARTMVTNVTSYDVLVGVGWIWCTIQWFYLLCVVCVTISIMVNANVMAQNNFKIIP
jgi:hypothetical protein